MMISLISWWHDLSTSSRNGWSRHVLVLFLLSLSSFFFRSPSCVFQSFHHLTFWKNQSLWNKQLKMYFSLSFFENSLFHKQIQWMNLQERWVAGKRTSYQDLEWRREYITCMQGQHFRQERKFHWLGNKHERCLRIEMQSLSLFLPS